MGKVRTRIIGLEDVEEKQKQKQKKKAQEKVVKLKGVEASKEEVSKDEKPETQPQKTKVKKATKARIRSKNYQAAKKEAVKDKLYTTSGAVKLLRKIKFTKFDESIELHLNLTASGLKGEVQLPHSTGKKVRVKVVDEAALKELEAGKIDFDILVTHPSYMPRLAKYARVLGPRGLMPSPKSGTITDKPEAVVKKFSTGILRFATEPKAPLLHQMVGKISLEDEKLEDNIKTLVRAIGKQNIQKAFIKSTMSPSLELDVTQL